MPAYLEIFDKRTHRIISTVSIIERYGQTSLILVRLTAVTAMPGKLIPELYHFYGGLAATLVALFFGSLLTERVSLFSNNRQEQNGIGKKKEVEMKHVQNPMRGRKLQELEFKDDDGSDLDEMEQKVYENTGGQNQRKKQPSKCKTMVKNAALEVRAIFGEEELYTAAGFILFSLYAVTQLYILGNAITHSIYRNEPSQYFS